MNVEAMATSEHGNRPCPGPPPPTTAAPTSPVTSPSGAYGDVMFLDHADAEGDAFTDAKSWWDGLGCEAMVEAVNDDRPAEEETNPFCKIVRRHRG